MSRSLKLFTTELTEDTEGKNGFPILCVLSVLRGGDFRHALSIHTDRGGRGKTPEWPPPADAVPRIPFVRWLPFALVALEKSRHEEFLRQRRELHAPRFSVTDDGVRHIEIDDLNDRARLRRVVGDLVIVVRSAWRAGGKAHQRVAIRGRHVRAVEQFLVRETFPLPGEFRAARENTGDAG